MPSIQQVPHAPTLPAIHAHWIATLFLPPTAQISNLRRLLRTLTRDHHPALRPLSLAALCPLYLDLALAYAFLGEYHLASTVFKEALDSDTTSPIGWFGLGLAQAELGQWRSAKRSWKNCLKCIESAGDQLEGIPYMLFQIQDYAAQDKTARRLKKDLKSRAWTLERTRVEFNYRVALCETGSEKLDLAPRAAGEKRPGLNGIPAGLRFGPCWDASLQSLDLPFPALCSGSNAKKPEDDVNSIGEPGPVVRTSAPSSFSRTEAALQTLISSHKALPPLPHSPPAPIPSLSDKDSFNDHHPSLASDPFKSSPGKHVREPFTSTSTPTLTITQRHVDEYQERFSSQSTLCTPELQELHEHSDDYDGGDEDDTLVAIDNTIASWSDVGTRPEDQDHSDGSKENLANATHFSTSHHHTDDSDGGETLQPRVFEGFGPQSNLK